MQIQYFDSLESTNKYCELLDLNQVEEFTVIGAKSQTDGIGQRGNHWESQPGKNLTFSLVLKPTFLPIEDQYQLTKVLALAVSDYLLVTLHNHIINIKWPNDIYVDGRKICGILTSNHTQAHGITASICGIGFNVNQTEFSEWIPNPTSLKQKTGKEYNIEEVLHELLEYVEKWYDRLTNDEWDVIDEIYLQRLYQYRQWAPYEYLEKPITARILDVDQYGHLVIETQENERINCDLKELKFIQLFPGW